MGKLHISAAAVKLAEMSGKIIDPGWYPATVVEVKQHPCKAGDSENSDVTFEINAGPFEGCRVYKTFNEKGAGFAVPFFNALGFEISKDGCDPDPMGTKGRQLKVLIHTGSFNGRPKNDIADYAPLE